jgi:hypothetical protein
MKLATKNALLLILIFSGLFCTIGMIGLKKLTSFPGQSYKGALPPETPEEAFIRSELKLHLETLAVKIGERNFERYDELNTAADYIEQSFVETL